MIDQLSDAVVEGIENWFFEKYLPSWVTVGADSHGDSRKVLDYWGVPMHAVALGTPPNQTRWLSTEEQVLGLLSAVQTPLKEQHYTHTNILDRRMTFYSDAAASIDVIWSRRNGDDAEIGRVAVHFVIRSVDGQFRIISLVSVPTDKEQLTDVFRY
jgi:hypothetical protein